MGQLNRFCFKFRSIAVYYDKIDKAYHFKTLNDQLLTVNQGLCKYNLYIFQTLPSGKIELINKEKKPRVSDTKQSDMYANLTTGISYYFYFSSNPLSDKEIKQLTGEESYRLIEVDPFYRVTTLNNSLINWLLIIQRLENHSGKKAKEILPDLVSTYSGKNDLITAYPDIKDGLLWMRENRYIILPGERVIDMLYFLMGIKDNIPDFIQFRELYYSAIIKSVNAVINLNDSFDGKLNRAKKLFKGNIQSPLTLMGAIYGYWFAKTEKHKLDDIKLSKLIESFFYSSERWNDHGLISDVSTIIDIDPGWNDLCSKLHKMHMQLLLPNIAMNPPELYSRLSWYNLDSALVHRCYHVVRNNRVKAIVGFKKGLREFSVAKYGDGTAPYEVTPCIFSDDAHIKNLVTVAEKAGMSPPEAFIFVVENARLIYKDMKFANQKSQDLAFADLMEKLASHFRWNGSHPIRYVAERIITQGHYNSIKAGLDCIGFQLTGVYILGYINKNIHYVGENVGSVVNTLEAIDKRMKEIDPEGIPYKIGPEDRGFFRFTHEGRNYCHAYSDFNDITREDKETLEFFEESSENGKLKELKTAVLSEDIKSQAINGTIKCEKIMYPCVPDDGIHYFSNGVRNALANVFGIFRFYHAEEVREEDRIGMIGVVRLPKNPVKGIDHTGVMNEFRGDYVSHVYTALNNEWITHSTGGKGLEYRQFDNQFRFTPKYYLQLRLYKK